MDMEKVTKWLGLIALLGGVARMGMAPSAEIWGTDSQQELIFGFIACLFMGVGIYGVYMHQAHRFGWLGFASTVLISLSSTLTACLVWSTLLGVTETESPYVVPIQNINSIVALIGMLLFCYLTVRAQIYPIWTVVLFLLFPVMSFIPLVTDWATVAWGLSYVGFGYYAFANRTVKSPPYFKDPASSGSSY